MADHDADASESTPPGGEGRPVRLRGVRSQRRAAGTLPVGPVPAALLSPELLRATIEAVETVGFDRIKFQRLVETVGESFASFARHYGGKYGLLYLAGRQTLDALQVTVRRALDGPVGQDPTTRATVGLTALMEALAVDPAAASLLVLHAPGAGALGQTLRGELLALIGEILDPLHPGTPDPAPGLPGITDGGDWSQGMYVGAVHEILHRRISRGEAAELPGVVPALIGCLTGGDS